MDKIKEQANVVGQLIFSSDTGDTYKKTLLLTWKILRETGVLIWLVLCLTFVGGEWFYRTSVTLGRNARVWYSNLGETPEGEGADAATSTGQALLETVQSSTSYLLSQARQQLGLKEPAPIPPPAPKVPKAEPANEPTASPSTSMAPSVPAMETTIAKESKVADEKVTEPVVKEDSEV
jgi:hypothetical protein